MRILAVGLATTVILGSCPAAMATVGSHAYARALAERRAATVKAEMIRLGLREDQIAIISKSFDDPLGPSSVDKEAGVDLAKDHPALIEIGR